MSLLGLQRAGSGPVLVWLHGFTQTKDSAHTFRSILAGTYELATVDLPGHGENASIRATLDESADLLANVLPLEPFTLGGYSLGGRVALHFALRHPERVARLVLLSATMGIRDEGARRERRERDDTLANHVEAIDIEAFLDEWLAQPLFASLPRDPLERSTRSRDPRGLANSLRDVGTGTQSWLGDRLSSLASPTLLLAGARDEKFVVEAKLLRAALANARLDLAPDAGHAAHLERPEDVAQLVTAFQPQ